MSIQNPLRISNSPEIETQEIILSEDSQSFLATTKTHEILKKTTVQFYLKKELDENNQFSILKAAQNLELKTFSLEALFSSNIVDRRKIVQEAQALIKSIGYESLENLSDILNVITKVLCLEFLLTENQDFTELNIEENQPLVYIAQILATSFINGNHNLQQSTKEIRKKFAEYLDSERDNYIDYFHTLMEIKEVNSKLYTNLLRDLLFEISDFNLEKSFYDAGRKSVQGYNSGLGHYRPNRRQNNQEIGNLWHSIDEEYLRGIIESYFLEQERANYPYDHEDAFNYEYYPEDVPESLIDIDDHPIIDCIQSNPILRSLFFNVDEDINTENLDQKIEFLYDIIKILTEKRDYLISRINKEGKRVTYVTNPYIESFFRYIQGNLQIHTHLFKGLKTLLNPKSDTPKTKLIIKTKVQAPLEIESEEQENQTPEASVIVQSDQITDTQIDETIAQINSLLANADNINLISDQIIAGVQSNFEPTKAEYIINKLNLPKKKDFELI